MCGRAYSTYTDEELYLEYLNRKERRNPSVPFKVAPNYNLCPTQNAPVLRLVDGERRFDEMHWQLIPKWEKEFTVKFSTINARSESVFESKLYGKLITRQRCIVPLSGFFEWKKEGTKKRPFKIFRQDGSIMSVAGIWDTWHADKPDARHSFSILTTSANEVMSGIHDRMPVILDQGSLDDWLDPEIHEPEPLQKLMKPCPNSWLATAEVSTLVNSPKNNTPAVLKTLEESRPTSLF